MDQKALSEVFSQLKGLLTTGTGKQWEAGKSRPPVSPGDGWQSGATEQEVVVAAEETRIHALGLGNQYRFRRKDSFSCGANPVTAPHRLGQIVIDGRQFYLNQTLIANRHPWLLGQRCLLAHGDHLGRRLKIAYKLSDGYHQSGATYQIAHKCKKAYTILRHGAGWLELDDCLEPHASGYLFFEFT